MRPQLKLHAPYPTIGGHGCYSTFNINVQARIGKATLRYTFSRLPTITMLTVLLQNYIVKKIHLIQTLDRGKSSDS